MMSTRWILGSWLAGSCACQPLPVEQALLAPRLESQGVEIGGTGHGLALGADGQILELDPQSALKVQRALLSQVMATAAELELGLDVTAQEVLDLQPLSTEEELVINDRLLSWMMEDPQL